MQLSSATAGSLQEDVIAIQREIDVLSARQAALLASWEAQKLWTSDGSRSAAHRYARETGLSLTDAKHLVFRARKLSVMPWTFSAFSSGSLSTSRVDLLVRTNQPNLTEVFARDKELLLEQVQSLCFSDACKAMKYWQHSADPEGSADRATRQFVNRQIEQNTISATSRCVGRNGKTISVSSGREQQTPPHHPHR